MSEPLFDFDAATPVIEVPSNDSPPKSRRKERSDKGIPRGARGTRKAKVDIASGIEELYTAVGLIVSVANQDDGEIIVESARRAGEVWARAAQKNEIIRRNLERFLVASTLAELIAFHATLGIKIAANHGIIPERLSDVLKKDDPTHVNGNGNGNGDGGMASMFGNFDPSSIPVDTLKEAFPQLNEEPVSFEPPTVYPVD